MPLSAGNIRETSFVDLWEKSDVFNSFRYPHLKGKCGDCEYTDICGGCRARPYVDHGDWLDEDQWCLYTPKGGEKIKVAFNTPEESHVAWDEDSEITTEPDSLLLARHGEKRCGKARTRERYPLSSPLS